MANSHTAQPPRIYLEVMDPDNKQHLDGYHTICSDPEYLAATFGKVYTREEAYELLQERCKSAKQPWIENYAVRLIDGAPADSSIGLVGVIRQEVLKTESGEEYEEFELGYGLHAKYWGGGWGSEAVAAFLNLYWGLESRKHVKYLLCWIGDWNEPSKKLCQKMGGRQREGVVKSLEGHNYEVWVIDRPKS